MAIHHCVVKRVEAMSIRAQVVTTHPHSISVPPFSPGEVLHHFNLTAYKQLDLGIFHDQSIIILSFLSSSNCFYQYSLIFLKIRIFMRLAVPL